MVERFLCPASSRAHLDDAILSNGGEEPRHIRNGTPPRALLPVTHPLPKMLGQREEDGRRHPPGECRGQQLPHGA